MYDIHIMKKILSKIILSLIFLLILSTLAYSAPYQKEKRVQVTIRNELNCGVTATIFEYINQNGRSRRTHHGPFTVFPERESHQWVRVFKNTLWLKVYINRVEIKKLQFKVNDSSLQSIAIVVKPGRQQVSLIIR